MICHSLCSLKFTLIIRNNNIVGTIDDPTQTTMEDESLSQGQTYTYFCQATLGTDKKKGAAAVVTIPASNPPVFAGITSLTATSSSALSVQWALGSGTKVNQYKIYCNTGSAIDWSKSPVATNSVSSSTSSSVGGLGDEISYVCGVRACAYGDICDTNTQTLTRTLPDGGAPRSQGISSVTLVNGQAVVNAPWAEGNGAVWKRRTYICTGAASSCGVDLANYALANTNISTQVYSPNTSITLSTIVSQNTTYSLLLTDEDPSGNVSTPQATPSMLVTGDLTKPTFAGLTSIASGTPSSQSDTTIGLIFTAIARESDNAVTGTS